MGLTPMRTLTLLLGQPARHAGRHRWSYVNAGTQLAQIDSAGRHPVARACWAASCCWACFRWWPRQSLGWLQRRKVYARWTTAAHASTAT
ncbi:MAG: hypothetical protein V9G23_15075 [Giesbergeria sp.]